MEEVKETHKEINWLQTKIGEICHFTGGGTPSKREPSYWNGDIPWASIKDLKGKSLKKTKDHITEVGLENSSTKVAKAGELIIGTRISPGKPILTQIDTAINQDLKVVRTKIELDNKFLFFLFLNEEARIRKVSSGTTVLGVSLKKLNELPVQIPPLPEQRAIVSKLEQLFSELEDGVANLQKAQRQLKVYRQAVLKKAFEGELTREWRAQQTGLPTAEELLQQIQTERERYYEQQLAEWKQAVADWEADGKVGKKPSKPKKMTAKSGEEPLSSTSFPKEWALATLGQVALRIQIGPFGSQLHKSDYQAEGIPVINPKHIKEQKIIPDVCIEEEKAESLSQYILQQNDIVLGRRGEMGRSAAITDRESGWLCGTGSLFIRLGDNFIGTLYSMVFSERRVVSYLEEHGSGTTMVNLNSKILSELPLQIISLPEQHQIVQEIESRLSVCDQLEKDIEANLKRAERLRQSLLQKAFAGELLTEVELQACRAAPDWEPAEKLLERIKGEGK